MKQKVKRTKEQSAMSRIDPGINMKPDQEQYKLATFAGRGRSSSSKAKPLSFSPKKK